MNLIKVIIITLATYFIVLALFFILGCGSQDYTPIESCIDVYTQSFCDSITGKDGLNGENGDRGTDGNNGIEGERGEQGVQGIEGATGPVGPMGREGEQGERGEPGIDGINGNDGKDSVIEIIDPCGKESEFDELLLRFSDNKLYAIYFDGKKLAFLTEIVDGVYDTTDGTNCTFKVIDGEVIW